MTNKIRPAIAEETRLVARQRTRPVTRANRTKRKASDNGCPKIQMSFEKRNKDVFLQRFPPAIYLIR
ncbi:hypothetical protein D3C86_2074430 [compost metagenome]